MEILKRGSGNLVKWSIAPELPGALELGDELASRGILPLMGHSNAKFDTVKLAVQHGYTQPELLKLIVKCKDHTHIWLLGSKAHGTPVIIKDGIANMPAFDGFAGSVATTDRLVRVMTQKAGLPVWDAVRMASLNPAIFLGKQDQYGSIAPGTLPSRKLSEMRIHSNRHESKDKQEKKQETESS